VGVVTGWPAPLAEFEVGPDAAGALAVGAGPAGIPLGEDHRGAPVLLRLFRPRPTRVVLVDRGWVERIVILRALALGARVVVHSPEPQHWAGFSEAVTGRPDRFAAVTPDRPFDPPASVTQPVLHVVEGAPPAQPPPAGAWCAQLTVAPLLGEQLTPAVLAADLLVLRRLSRREMAVAASVRRLEPRDNAALRTAPDNGLVVFGAGSTRYVMVAATAFEQAMFGSPGA
jgi:hypothetical protein